MHIGTREPQGQNACIAHGRNETKPRCSRTKPARFTRENRSKWSNFLLFSFEWIFSHIDNLQTAKFSQPVPLRLSSIAAFIDEVKLACEYSGRLSSLSAGLAFRETPKVLPKKFGRSTRTCLVGDRRIALQFLQQLRDSSSIDFHAIYVL